MQLASRPTPSTQLISDLTNSPDSQPQAQLGDLVEFGAPMGYGAHGVVWSAVHRVTGRQLAVKFVRPGRSTQTARRFVAEGRRLARIIHPHIVSVYDLGLTTSLLCELPKGTPYIVMNRAESALRAQSTGDHSTIIRVLSDVLSGLSRLHALGLLHRDIKPGNVLCTHEMGDTRYLVADLGIAIAWQSGEVAPYAAGTPRYMAPEQVLGDMPAHGPATDIYAVGRLAEWMVDRWKIDVADSPLQSWIDIATHHSPSERFQTAADASAMLYADLPELVHTGQAGPRATATAGAVTLGQTTLLSQTGEMAQVGAATQRTPSNRAPKARVNLPEWQPHARWHRVTGRRRWLWNTGVGAIDTVAIRVHGRSELQDQLWRLYLQARNATRPTCVRLCGPVDSGRSRLAEWLATTCHEIGGSHGWVVDCSNRSGGNTGADLLQAILGVADTDPEYADPEYVATAAARRGVLDQDELAEFKMSVGRRAVAHQVACISMLLRADTNIGPFATPRAPVLVLLNADQNPAARDLAQRLLDDATARHYPILMVLTDAGAETAPVAHEPSHRFELNPLSAAVIVRALEDAAPLAVESAAKIASNADGLPEVAFQQLVALANHNRLQETTDGIVVVPPSHRAVSNDDRSLLDLIRLNGIEFAAPHATIDALGLLAIGRNQHNSWLKACERINNGVRVAATEAMELGLIEFTSTKCRFAVPEFRRLIVEGATDEQRSRWRTAWVNSLEDSNRADDQTLRAQLLWANRDAPRALRTAIHAAQMSLDAHELHTALLAIAVAETVITNDRSLSDKAGGEVWFLSARILNVVEDHPLALKYVDLLTEWAQAQASPRYRAAAFYMRAEVAFDLGGCDDARSCLASGLRELEADDWPWLRARIHSDLAYIHCFVGDIEPARRELDNADRVAATMNDERLLIRCLMYRATLQTAEGETLAALASFEGLMSRTADVDDPSLRPNVELGRGSALMALGRSDEALLAFDAAAMRSATLQSDAAHSTAMLNRALLLTQMGRWSNAVITVDKLRTFANGRNSVWWVPCADSVAFLALAHLQRADEARRTFESIRESKKAIATDPQVGQLLHDAAMKLAEDGDDELAADAATLACDVCRAAGDVERAESASALAQTLAARADNAPTERN